MRGAFGDQVDTDEVRLRHSYGGGVVGRCSGSGGYVVEFVGCGASVIRINDGGSPDAAGTHLRISGGNNQTADSNGGGGNGPSASKNDDGGIGAEAGKTFRLPAIDVTVIAGGAGSTVQPKLRVTDGNSGSFDSPKNAFTFLQREKDVFTVAYWERYNCSPHDSRSAGLNAGGQALATVNIVSQVATTTAVTSGASATIGQSTDLIAQVSPGADRRHRSVQGWRD